MDRSVHLRVARPSDDLETVVRFYTEGLGFTVLSQFTDHDGFDGVMLGHAGAAYHLEFTRKAGHEAGRAPTRDNLLVFYLPDPGEWQAAVDRLLALGHRPVESFNPYWDRRGVTFEDPDGYRVVLQNAAWPTSPQGAVASQDDSRGPAGKAHEVARRGGLVVSTDPALLDLGMIHDFLSNRSYWAAGRPLEVVRRSLDSSLCFGLYEGSRQIGLARVVTDGATFAWLCDVFVLEPYRGRGLAKWLVECVMGHPDLQGLRRFLLATQDAHGLYERFGFAPLAEPARFLEVFRPGRSQNH
jgi:catechol 2,3-dioxygenase-like lactoylglutathione lyase family enzyme